jgi:sec-independent protein translocase protein TatC
MLAIPLYLLFELGILAAGFLSKPTLISSHQQSASNDKMEQELGKTETEEGESS